MNNSDKEKKQYQIFRLDEVDEVASRENRPEVTEKIQNRNAKVWVPQCQRKGGEQMDWRET